MIDLSTRRLILIACVLTLTGVLACGGRTDPTAPSTPGDTSGSSGPNSGGSNGTGTLAVHITDSPFSDAKALLVTFSEVNVHSADGDSWHTIPFASGSSRTCDLKKLQGPTDVLGVGTLPAAHYTQIRLVVSSATIYFDNATSGPACAASIAEPAGKNAPVDIPSGEVKLNREFTITSGATTMLLDFDGDKSVKATGGGGNGNGNSNSSTKYIMTPVVSIVSVQ